MRHFKTNNIKWFLDKNLSERFLLIKNVEKIKNVKKRKKRDKNKKRKKRFLHLCNKRP